MTHLLKKWFPKKETIPFSSYNKLNEKLCDFIRQSHRKNVSVIGFDTDKFIKLSDGNFEYLIELSSFKEYDNDIFISYTLMENKNVVKKIIHFDINNLKYEISNNIKSGRTRVY